MATITTPMITKCSFCRHARLNMDGEYHCPHVYCILSWETLENMMRLLGKQN